jgi:hypothetical protein
VRIASNDNGITGGIHLWNEAIWHNVRGAESRQAAPEHGQPKEVRFPSSATENAQQPNGPTSA